MNNRLKIALKCTKYLLVAALVTLPFIGPEQTKAKAEEDGYTHDVVEDKRCDSGDASICYDFPGGCPTLSASCLVEGWDDY